MYFSTLDDLRSLVGSRVNIHQPSLTLTRYKNSPVRCPAGPTDDVLIFPEDYLDVTVTRVYYPHDDGNVRHGTVE